MVLFPLPLVDARVATWRRSYLLHEEGAIGVHLKSAVEAVRSAAAGLGITFHLPIVKAMVVDCRPTIPARSFFSRLRKATASGSQGGHKRYAINFSLHPVHRHHVCLLRRFYFSQKRKYFHLETAAAGDAWERIFLCVMPVM